MDSAVTTSPRTDLIDADLDFLARYFAMGIGSEIVSHPPHEVIGRQCEAFHRLLEKGLIISEPYNNLGVVRITCTEEAARLGRERSRALMLKMFDQDKTSAADVKGDAH